MDKYYIRNSFGELEYNNNGTMENEIFIIVDKMANGTITTYDKRLIDVLHEYYNKHSIECTDDVYNVITECAKYSKWKHIQILSEYMHMTTYNDYRF